MYCFQKVCALHYDCQHAGPILSPFGDDAAGDPFPHSMEPQLRALGLHTSLVRGVPSLTTPHQLCRADETLTSEQCRILKLLGVQMAVSFSSPHKPLTILRSFAYYSARGGPKRVALCREMLPTRWTKIDVHDDSFVQHTWGYNYSSVKSIDLSPVKPTSPPMAATFP